MKETTPIDEQGSETTDVASDDATTMQEAEELTTPDVAEDDDAFEATKATTKPKKALWKRPLVMVPLALLLVVTVSLVVLAQPSEPEPDFVPNARSSHLYYLLADIGIVDALVDVQEEYVLVRYNIPEGVDAEETLYRVLGTTYAVVSDVDRVILQVYEDYTPVEEITIKMEDITLFIRGFIDQAMFEASWERQ